MGVTRWMFCAVALLVLFEIVAVHCYHCGYPCGSQGGIRIKVGLDGDGCTDGYGNYGYERGGCCGSGSCEGGLKIKLGLGSNSCSSRRGSYRCRGCGRYGGCDVCRCGGYSDCGCGKSEDGLAIKLGLESGCRSGFGSCKCHC